MRLRRIKEIVEEIKQKGYTNGLNSEDFKELKNILGKIREDLVVADQEWYAVYMEIADLVNRIYRSGILYTYTKDNCKYIVKNSSLLPLVLANSKIDNVEVDDKSLIYNINNTMKVDDVRNYLYCCENNYNIITYLLKKEGLNFKKAIQLLAQIYLYDIPIYDNDLEDLVNKYQKVIISEHYKKLVNDGYYKLKERNIETIYGISREKYYEDKLAMIERVKSGEYDKNFQYIAPAKIMYLPK